MRGRVLLFAALLMAALPLSLTGLAQDDDIPTVGLLNIGHDSGTDLSVKGVLDVFQAYGFLSEEERAFLEAGQDLYGEKLNVLWRNAGHDIPTANLVVEDALDRGVDAMLTISTQMTQIAATATREMEDPPVIIFSLVGSPYSAGIADAPCVKPDHVGGSQFLIPYDHSVSLLRLWNPELERIGMIVAPAQQISVYGGRLIQQAAEELGLTVEVAAVTALSDINLAVEALANKGVEAIFNPFSFAVFVGTPLMQAVTAEHGIPLFALAPLFTFDGATVGAGFNDTYGEGVIQGRMLVAHLNGDIDISEIRINQSQNFAIAVNLDSAQAQRVEIPDELLEMAAFVIEDGVSNTGATRESPEVNTTLPDMPIQERRAADLAFLAALECTPEMIAEQQATLAGADE